MPKSVAPLSNSRLIVAPAVITLAVTLLRLLGKLQHCGHPGSFAARPAAQPPSSALSGSFRSSESISRCA
jgi:hypothetical protein